MKKTVIIVIMNICLWCMCLHFLCICQFMSECEGASVLNVIFTIKQDRAKRRLRPGKSFNSAPPPLLCDRCHKILMNTYFAFILER